MKLLTSKLATAISFAHLASVRGGTASAKVAAEDDDKKDDDKKEEEDTKASAKGRANDDSDDDSAKADDPSAGDDDDDKDENKGKKAKAKSAKADDDDAPKKKDGDDEDDDEEMRGKGANAQARLREQARCAAIMGCKAAGRNVELAAKLAMTTRMPRDEAIGLLESSPTAAAPAGQGRESRNPRLGSGGDVSRDSTTAISAGWDRAFAKAGVTRRS